MTRSSSDKQSLREARWQALQQAGAARFPGTRGRIPNFVGARLGKGGGYSDLEYAMLRELDLVGAEVPIFSTLEARWRALRHADDS